MKVFISWSGDLSQRVAEALHQWIKLVVQATEPWISSEGIDKGAIWFSEVSEQLATTSAGIVCLTGDNLESPWLLFEAGGLANKLSKSRVYTLLIDVGHSDLKPPLSLFNGTLLVEEDMFKLVKGINAGLGEKALNEDVLRAAFDAHWPALSRKIEAFREAHKSAPKVEARTLEDMVDEILETSRATYTAVSNGTTKGSLAELIGPIGHSNESKVGEALGQLITNTIQNDVLLNMQLRSAIQRLIQRVDKEPRARRESLASIDLH